MAFDYNEEGDKIKQNFEDDLKKAPPKNNDDSGNQDS